MMKLRTVFVLGIMFSLILACKGLIFGQGQALEEQPVQENPSQPQMQWVWAEAVSVDINAKQLLVKYFDYDSGSEKEEAMNVDDATAYENINSLDEIKPQDTVSIDYIINPSGKNIAKNISLERSEDLNALQEGISAEELKGTPGARE